MQEKQQLQLLFSSDCKRAATHKREQEEEEGVVGRWEGEKEGEIPAGKEEGGGERGMTEIGCEGVFWSC